MQYNAAMYNKYSSMHKVHVFRGHVAYVYWIDTIYVKIITNQQNFKFNTPKNEKLFMKVRKKDSGHIQCVNNHYTKFEYKEMKADGSTPKVLWTDRPMEWTH